MDYNKDKNRRKKNVALHCISSTQGLIGQACVENEKRLSNDFAYE